MNKNTKLNGAIKSLFKSKAKTQLEARGSAKVRTASEEIRKLVIELRAIPGVETMIAAQIKAFNKYSEAQAALQMASSELHVFTGCSYSSNGQFSDFNRHGTAPENKAAAKIWMRGVQIENEKRKAEACHCPKTDDPELLEFVANLSLLKTVGEAEELLSKL